MGDLILFAELQEIYERDYAQNYKYPADFLEKIVGWRLPPSNRHATWNTWKERGVSHLARDEIRNFIKSRKEKHPLTTVIENDRNLPIPFLRYEQMQITHNGRTFVEYTPETVDAWLSLPKRELPEHRLAFIQLKHHHSMFPTLREGDIVLLDFDDTVRPDDSLYIINWKSRYEPFTVRRIIMGSLHGHVIVKASPESGEKEKRMSRDKVPIVAKIIGLFRQL